MEAKEGHMGLLKANKETENSSVRNIIAGSAAINTPQLATRLPKLELQKFGIAAIIGQTSGCH